jgi:hypothetical protein
MMTDVAIWADNFLAAHPEYADDIKGLKDIADKDYSADIESALGTLNKA